MLVRLGDNMTVTRQTDDSYNVVLDMKHRDGDRRVVTNVKDTGLFYTKQRALLDNPPVIDLAAEKEQLLERRDFIDVQIVNVDAEIAKGK